MNTQNYDLKSLLDMPLWEAMQDQLAKLTGMAFITVDFEGNPVSKHSGRSDFCAVIRENPATCKRCCRCDALAGLEAIRIGKPYIYLCHCGIVDVAVPIMAGDRYVGAILFGQVRLPDGSAGDKVERLVGEISSFHAQSDAVHRDLMDKYRRLPEMEYKWIEEVADFVASMVRYIVHRTGSRRSKTLTDEYRLRGGAEPAELPELGPTPEPIRGPEDLPVSKDSPVYPAIVYVYSHRREAVTMNQMANLCQLSPSYFSRLFHWELGENFSVWANRQKVAWAKEQLRSGNESISQIAKDLGFKDPSYFINVFKRFEGITPLVYRQNRYRN